jgi:hypothetical protein
VLLALGWIPVNLPTMIVAVFLFGVTNVGARLVLTRWRQEPPGPGRRGDGRLRVRQDRHVGRCRRPCGRAFSAGFGAYGAFGLVGGMLGLFAAAQLAIARFLARMPTPDTLQALERRSRWLPSESLRPCSANAMAETGGGHAGQERPTFARSRGNGHPA